MRRSLRILRNLMLGLAMLVVLLAAFIAWLLRSESGGAWVPANLPGVKIEARDTTHIKGSLKTGNGGCPGPGGTIVYCTATGSYTFDAAFVK